MRRGGPAAPSPVLPGGLKAHRFLFNLGKDSAAGSSSGDRFTSELVTMIHGKMVLVTCSGDQSLFYVIAGSLRESK